MHSNTLKKSVWFKTKPGFVSSLVAVLGLLLMLVSAQAQVIVFTNTWPIYEPFSEYTNPVPFNIGAGQSATNWTFGNGTSSSNFRVTNAAAMSYPALQSAADNTNGVQEIPSGSNSSGDRGIMFAPRSTTIYTSFLLNYQDSGGMTENRLAYQLVTGAAAGSFTRAYSAIWLTPDYRLVATKNYNEANSLLTAKFTSKSPVLTRNIPHLVVMRYLKVPGNNDQLDIWVDPTAFGDNATIPPSTISTTNGANIASFNGLLLNHRKVNNQSGNTFSVFQVDEIRLGSTWAEVTPLATPAPGPIFAVTGGGVGCPSDTISVGISGSVSTNDYLLFTNNVYMATFPGTGAAIDFGSQTTLGRYTVLASNVLTADIGWMSNAVSVAIKAPATIVTQPIPMTVATNSRAEFKVVASGDLITYQWFKDGSATPLSDDAHLTGSTNASLVIWPAASSDIGSYYCVVSDTCGNVVYTFTNTLTLAPPADLVWAGDAFNVNVWDVFAASAEWTGGTGFFNPGDNVTFNDAYTFSSAIALKGILAPGNITVDASRDYRWSGTGIIAGTTSLTKTGSGTLILDNNPDNTHANAFTGGTIISNGAVNLTNSWYSLGSGTVTLAGGTLETWQKGSTGGGVEQGLTNALTITANSTWQVDRTGDQAAAFMGPFTVGSGLTLRVTNSATTVNSLNRLRIGSVFTNDLNYALSFNTVATGASQDLASYNPTGAQVYNGVISGTDCGFQVAAAGPVYLNGANTYTRYTLVTAGFLGGSGSVASPLTVSNGATLGAGSQSAIGTFTVNNSVNLNGNLRIRVDKSLVQSNDLIVASGLITNGGSGTLTLTNIGASPIQGGDTFKLFSSAVSNGSALTITDGGANAWINNLAVDGSVQAVTIASYSTNISFVVTGNNLNISWPTTHLGWILQSQTNSLTTGLGSNWSDVPGTAGATSKSVPVSQQNPAVFYRLRHP